jgi:hypothetical protein
MSQVFSFVDDARTAFWEARARETAQLLDPETGKVSAPDPSVDCPICRVDDAAPVFVKEASTSSNAAVAGSCMSTSAQARTGGRGLQGHADRHAGSPCSRAAGKWNGTGAQIRSALSD